MRRSSLVWGSVFLLQMFSTAHGEIPNSEPNAVTIPLSQIWAYEMPGTRDIRDLDQNKIGKRSLVSEMLQLLTVLKPGEKAKSGFAVCGSGKDALREAHAVLKNNKEPRVEFSMDCDVTLVFFSSVWLLRSPDQGCPHC